MVRAEAAGSQRLPWQRVRVKHYNMKQEEERKDELRAQRALDSRKSKNGIPHGVAQIFGAVLARMIPFSHALYCRVL